MHKIIQSCGDLNLDEIFIDWPLTNWCNYKCSYCPVLRDLSNNFNEPDHSLLHNLTLTRLKNLSSNFNICITGGEPALHPQINKIIYSLVNMSNCVNIAFFTNLSRSLKYYKSFSQLKTDKLGICASFHPEFADQTKFIEKVIAINSSGIKINTQVSIPDDINKIHNLIDLMDQLREHNVECYPLILKSTADFTPNYTNELYQLIRPYMLATSTDNQFKEIACVFTDGSKETLRSFDIEIQQMNKFKGYRCTPRRFQISMSGEIKNSCTERRVALGDNNVVKDEICPHDICPSRRMLTFYKERV